MSRRSSAGRVLNTAGRKEEEGEEEEEERQFV